jgi:hypothetical protein
MTRLEPRIPVGNTAKGAIWPKADWPLSMETAQKRTYAISLSRAVM